MWGGAGGAGAEPGPREWEVRTRQWGRSRRSPTALAGGSHGPSTHGLPQPSPACPPRVSQHCCCGATPCWHQSVHTHGAFAASQPHQRGALGLCRCPLGMRAFCRMCSLSAAHWMASRPEQQLCAPPSPCSGPSFWPLPPSPSWTAHFQPLSRTLHLSECPAAHFHLVLTDLSEPCCTVPHCTAPIVRPLEPACHTQGLEHPSVRASSSSVTHGCARSMG